MSAAEMILKKYRCSACGLMALISGGRDMTRNTYSQTFACLGVPLRDGTRGADGCGVIADAVTEFTEWDAETASELVVTEPPPQCTGCKYPCTPWNDGDPCPKCRGKGTFLRDETAGETFVD